MNKKRRPTLSTKNEAPTAQNMFHTARILGKILGWKYADSMYVG